MSGGGTQALPRWADLVLLPAVCLAVALLVAGGVVALVGQSPKEVITVLVHGAFGTARGFSYTLYYATTFVFTGLAVAVAFHGGLFNIEYMADQAEHKTIPSAAVVAEPKEEPALG